MPRAASAGRTRSPRRRRAVSRVSAPGLLIGAGQVKAKLMADSLDRARAALKRRGVAVDVLAWWDRHRRELPWRAAPGERPDPYRVWLSEVLLQQTTATGAAPYFLEFVRRWPNVEELAAAPLEEVMQAFAGLGYYSRARNLHACAKRSRPRAGAFPSDEAALRALPGVGPYTAAAIAAIAFDRPAAPVDGNIARILSRLFAFETPVAANRRGDRGVAEGADAARSAPATLRRR